MKRCYPIKNHAFDPPHSFKATYFSIFGQFFEGKTTEVKNQDFVKVASPESDINAEILYM